MSSRTQVTPAVVRHQMEPGPAPRHREEMLEDGMMDDLSDVKEGALAVLKEERDNWKKRAKVLEEELGIVTEALVILDEDLVEMRASRDYFHGRSRALSGDGSGTPLAEEEGEEYPSNLGS